MRRARDGPNAQKALGRCGQAHGWPGHPVQRCWPHPDAGFGRCTWHQPQVWPSQSLHLRLRREAGQDPGTP